MHIQVLNSIIMWNPLLLLYYCYILHKSSFHPFLTSLFYLLFCNSFFFYYIRKDSVKCLQWQGEQRMFGKNFRRSILCVRKGSLKDQKVSAGEVMRGFVSLKQWHMKPPCSLSDEQKLSLLRKVK